jgi:hypothetical protein
MSTNFQFGTIRSGVGAERKQDHGVVARRGREVRRPGVDRAIEPELVAVVGDTEGIAGGSITSI